MISIHIEQNQYGNWVLIKSTVRHTKRDGKWWATDQCKLNTAFIELEDAQRCAKQMPADWVVYLTPYVRPYGVGVIDLATLGDPCLRNP